MKYKFSAIVAMLAILVFVGVGFATSPRKGYYNYSAMLEKGTADLREYLSKHPEVHVDSLRAKVFEELSWSKIGGVKLQSASTKVLTPAEVYVKGKKSSLVFGKMEIHPYLKTDTAYANASAVALTADGICATNYHVIADVPLTGALDYRPERDRMRFVMDMDGNFYPMTKILKVDPINDLAIIKVDTRGRKLVPASVGSDVRPGDAVYCLSHPSGAFFYITDGIVSNCTEQEDRKSGQRKYILEISADYAAGASGGPIYDNKGNLVGIISSTISMYANQQQKKDFQMTYKQSVPVFLIKESFK